MYPGVTPEGSELTFVMGPKRMEWSTYFEHGDIKMQQEGEGIYLYIYIDGKWTVPPKPV